MQQIKRTYKEGVFSKVFNDKESLIELYNALSGRNYSVYDKPQHAAKNDQLRTEGI